MRVLDDEVPDVLQRLPGTIGVGGISKRIDTHEEQRIDLTLCRPMKDRRERVEHQALVAQGAHGHFDADRTTAYICEDMLQLAKRCGPGRTGLLLIHPEYWASVAYVPNGRIVGLSKIARVVEEFARRLQVQERLTSQIADTLWERLAPEGVGVILQATHTCMTMRGVRKPGAVMVTSAVRGTFKSRSETRAEFMNHVNC